MTIDLAVAVEPLVQRLYPEQHEAVTRDLVALAERWAGQLAGRRVPRLSERSAFLITYGDAIRRPGGATSTLGEVLRDHVGEAVSTSTCCPCSPGRQTTDSPSSTTGR